MNLLHNLALQTQPQTDSDGGSYTVTPGELCVWLEHMCWGWWVVCEYIQGVCEGVNHVLGLELLQLGSARLRGSAAGAAVCPIVRFFSLHHHRHHLVAIAAYVAASALIRNRRYTTVSWITSKNEGDLHTITTHNRPSHSTRHTSHVTSHTSAPAPPQCFDLYAFKNEAALPIDLQLSNWWSCACRLQLAPAGVTPRRHAPLRQVRHVFLRREGGGG